MAVLRLALRAELLLEEHLRLATIQRATDALLEHGFAGPKAFAAIGIVTGFQKERLLAPILDHTHVLWREPCHIVGSLVLSLVLLGRHLSRIGLLGGIFHP